MGLTGQLGKLCRVMKRLCFERQLGPTAPPAAPVAIDHEIQMVETDVPGGYVGSMWRHASPIRTNPRNV